MVGFGYLEVTYTYYNNTTEVYHYIEVASGLVSGKAGYFNIDYSAVIDNACAINMF